MSQILRPLLHDGELSAAHWVRRFKLSLSVPVIFTGPLVGSFPEGAVAGGGAVDVPTDEAVEHFRRALSK